MTLKVLDALLSPEMIGEIHDFVMGYRKLKVREIASMFAIVPAEPTGFSLSCHYCKLKKYRYTTTPLRFLGLTRNNRKEKTIRGAHYASILL